MLLNLFHALTCKHRDVHRLKRPPRLVRKWWDCLACMKMAMETVKDGVVTSTHQCESQRISRTSSVPTPGLKDVNTGSESPNVSLACDHRYTHQEGTTSVCFKCGQATNMEIPGSSIL